MIRKGILSSFSCGLNMFASLSLGSLVPDSTKELELRFPSAALSVSLDLMLPNRGLEPDLFVSGLKKDTSFFFSSNLIVNNRRVRVRATTQMKMSKMSYPGLQANRITSAMAG